jgi:SH3 domain protein
MRYCLQIFTGLLLAALVSFSPFGETAPRKQAAGPKARPARAAAAAPAEARKGYITDRIEVPLRIGQGHKAKLVKMLTSGTPLTVLAEDSRTGFANVRLASGETGWVPAHFVVYASSATQPPAAAPKPEKTAQQLQAELQRQNTELIAIRQASSNALQIQAERDQLQESVISLERELESLRREKNALDQDNRQDWFLAGAGVLIIGILIGAFLPRFGWRKKSSWDSF